MRDSHPTQRGPTFPVVCRPWGGDGGDPVRSHRGFVELSIQEFGVVAGSLPNRPGGSKDYKLYYERWIFIDHDWIYHLVYMFRWFWSASAFGILLASTVGSYLPGTYLVISQSEVEGIMAGPGSYVSGRWVGI